ncbi:hypothetical protein RYZ26_15490 [Terasakiella sp. A23]|uniref:hypothetical protein n=1 Tax=Terasakiella sp. FCG-A23 TaxID=3080561 RepID=UPI0029545709|nr:hypothetical protein [Terasakiella sp. A23]MDV7341009.1 hypothetical protein [Terasakiella sp. A23]
MARKKSSRTQPHPDQFDMFAQQTGIELIEAPAAPNPDNGGLDCKMATRQWLATALKLSDKSREEVAALLSAWTGTEVSKHNIDMWTKDSHPSDLPAHYVAPLTVILGSNFLDWFAQQAGCRVAGTSHLYYARIGQMVVMQQTAAKQILKDIADLPLMQAGGEA